jgi:hypothetical protein
MEQPVTPAPAAPAATPTPPAGGQLDLQQIKTMLNLPDTATDIELITALVELVAGLQQKYEALLGDAVQLEDKLTNRDMADFPDIITNGVPGVLAQSVPDQPRRHPRRAAARFATPSLPRPRLPPKPRSRRPAFPSATGWPTSPAPSPPWAKPPRATPSTPSRSATAPWRSAKRSASPLPRRSPGLKKNSPPNKEPDHDPGQHPIRRRAAQAALQRPRNAPHQRARSLGPPVLPPHVQRPGQQGLRQPGRGARQSCPSSSARRACGATSTSLYARCPRPSRCGSA